MGLSQYMSKIHVKNRQKLATEMFMISKKFSVPLMSKLLHQKVEFHHLSFLYQMLLIWQMFTHKANVQMFTDMAVSTI